MGTDRYPYCEPQRCPCGAGIVRVESVCTDHSWADHGADERTEVTIDCATCRALWRWNASAPGPDEVLVGPDGERRVLYTHPPAKPHDPTLLARQLNGGEP
jgi:hypothetical protein